MQASAPDGGPCSDGERSKCHSRIESEVRTLKKLSPDTSDGIELQARLLALDGKLDEAESLLARECEGFRTRQRCAKLRARLASKVRSSQKLSVAIKSLLSKGCDGAVQCADLFASAAELYAAAGEHQQALVYFEKAAQEDPDAERWTKVARAASRVGSHFLASQALARAQRQRGGATSQGLRSEIRDEQRKALEEVESSPPEAAP